MNETTVKISAFRKKCIKASGELSEDVCFYTDDAGSADAEFYDDGVLHIRRKGERACFCIGEYTPGKKANEMMARIMTTLGMAKKIGPSVQVEEESDEDLNDECRCAKCGDVHSKW